jgi:hypothetical protein
VGTAAADASAFLVATTSAGVVHAIITSTTGRVISFPINLSPFKRFGSFEI